MEFEKITLEEAINRMLKGEKICLLKVIDEGCTIRELNGADGFVKIDKVEAEKPGEPKLTMIEEVEADKSETEPEKRTEKKPGKSTGRARLDIGKITALYNAGWAIAKIADEMGCSDQTVRNYLNKYTKPVKKEDEE